jgi:hypothetical protein
MTYEKNNTYFNEIVLYTFESPSEDTRKEFMIKITVIEPDEKLLKYCKDLQICISVSSMV